MWILWRYFQDDSKYEHRSVECPTYTTPAARRDWLAATGRCTCCTRPLHQGECALPDCNHHPGEKHWYYLCGNEPHPGRNAWQLQSQAMSQPTYPSGHPTPSPQISIQTGTTPHQPGVNNYINSNKDVMSISPTLIVPLTTNGDRSFRVRTLLD